MKFFIDTANLEQIKEAKDLGILDGVTTNPSLMAKEGIRGAEAIKNHYKAICEIVDGDISAEVLSTTYEEMIKEGFLETVTNKTIVARENTKLNVTGVKYINVTIENNTLILDFTPGSIWTNVFQDIALFKLESIL